MPSSDPSLTRNLNISLLIIRVSAAAFLAVWASLKFYRPEWMGNVFRNTYGMKWLEKDAGISFLGMDFGFLDIAYIIGSFQYRGFSNPDLCHDYRDPRHWGDWSRPAGCPMELDKIP